MTLPVGMKDDGGSAFPRPYLPGSGEKQDGMSLRDYFAGKVLDRAVGMSKTGSKVDWEYDFAKAAEFAYAIADAMLAEREKK